MNGGTPELFLRCSKLHHRADILKAELRDLQRHPAITKDQQLTSELRRHGKEARRLEKIANIMRSSDKVQTKYGRAVRRYKQAYSRYKEHREIVDRMSRRYKRRRDALQSTARRVKSECKGNWNNSILNRFCSSGSAKHNSFCSNFSNFRATLKKKNVSSLAVTDRYSDCNQSKNADLQIRGCTEIINQKSRKDLSIAYNSRGVAYLKKGQYDRAIADYSKAINLNPRYAHAYYNRGNAYRYKGQYGQSIADQTKAIQINPKYPFAYVARGWAYEKEKLRHKAIADYKRALGLNPKLEWTRKALKRLGVKS
ncbi:MAG: tetratricopeptide repeat protein [Hyphomicrobiaceae bacterium]